MGSEILKQPKIDEFLTFCHYLVGSAPRGYRPWFFRLEKGAKNPALEFGSWKNPKAWLNVTQAAEWMKEGGNVGIAAMVGDPLINVDIDSIEVTPIDLVKPTLMATTRSREGVHAWYFGENIPNISTENAGEVRANNQYVVAPGSYVTTDPDAVPEGERENAGYYTLLRRQDVATLKFYELPPVFITQYKKNKEATEEMKKRKPREHRPFAPGERKGKMSAVYKVKATDIIWKEGGETKSSARFPSLFHNSRTGKNSNISNRGLYQCWRHEVSLNGLQCLVVMSGYMTCDEAGTPHKMSGSGPSRMIGDNGAIFNAWKIAKERGYIPHDDPVPIRAMIHIALSKRVCNADDIIDGMMPAWVYNRVIDIIEEA